MLNLFRKKEDTGSAFQQAGQSSNTNFIAKLFDKNEKEVAKIRPLIDKINTLGPALKEQSDDELKAKSQELRERFQKLVTERLTRVKDAKSGETYEWQELNTEHEWTNEYVTVRRATESAVLDELLPEAFALTREAGDRTIGLRHFDVQLIGGTVLHTGRIGEMRTGEGKTLVATAPAYLNALSGRGVHVITVNDYLAERDANWMRPIYEFLGLSVAFLTNDMQSEDRQVAYGSDILYATNSEVGFDYLRDNMAKQSGEMVQRALNFAIVDEVDNILIDEARTPLIISAQVAKTDRAQRRQQMAKTCDGLARRLMPGITDREIDTLLDGLTTKGRLDTDTLLNNVLKRGAFTEATNYLIDSYLLAEKSARLENAARLLDVAEEFADAGLIDATGRTQLETLAVNAVRPEGVRQAWDAELSHLVAPFASAWVEGAHAPDVTTRIGTLAWELALSDEVATELASRFNEDTSAAPRQQVAEVVADEMVQRGFVSESGRGHVIEQLQGSATDASVEKVSSLLRELVLSERGSLQETDTLIQAALEAGGQGSTPAEAHKIIGAIEEISLRGLLPFEPLEHLWDAVRLTQGREGLRKEIAGAMSKTPGTAATKIGVLVRDYAQERETYLKREADVLRQKLNGHEAVAREASIGHDDASLRRTLLTDLTKTGAFAQAMKAARAFWAEQGRAHDQFASHLAEEMAVYVEVPRDARKQLSNLLAEGGKGETVRGRILLAVRDLPGENTELPAIVGDTTSQLETWRQEAAQKLLDSIASAGVQLPIDAQDALRLAIENGEYSAGWDGFVGEQLLSAPEAAPKADAIDDFADGWEKFKEDSNGRLLDGIAQAAELSQDAVDAVADLLDKPLPTQLEGAIFTELASDAVSRHLEPLLTEENAPAFTEEVKRRIPLAKETQKGLKASEFVGRSSEQLQRALVRLLERSFSALPFEDFKRVVRNIGWLTEKDEKRRTASLTDMGTLVAEREAGRPVFTDPDGFLDTLQAGEILTDEEAATVRHAEAETPDVALSEVIDRVLRLPAERRRRLSEAKYQEIAPVLDQSIKAHGLFQREVNYVIDTNPENGKREIVIVDEFTGRKMPGRRYSEGLHEALEAKHDLEVQLESQTVATITIQNYFRLYNKLAGMTGTAKTEEQEFAKTYGIEVVSIPTNRIVRRKDHPDVVFKTNEAKMRAVTFEILEHHCAGQPVLCGTRSVEVSERLSERLKPQALQGLVLSHLCKDKIRSSKDIPEDQQIQMLEVLRAPLVTPTPEEAHHLKSQNKRVEPASVMQIKSIAKAIGMNPEASHDDNVDALMALFTVPNTSRELLLTALRVGLPHNVLNAKNHRNEARIIAEAARPSSVTIATNMAGRGVDILLGGSLDVESRWRVMTLQTFARHLAGEPIHVRARNQDATDKFLDRLSAEKLQLLAWLTANVQVADELQKTGALEGQAVKDIREILGAEITTADIPTKVRSRARRLNLADKLPLDAEMLDAGPVEALARELKKLTSRTFEPEKIREALQSGVAAQTSGRDMLEMALLQSLSLPLGFAWRGTEALIEELPDLPDLDRALLDMVVETKSTDAAELAEGLGVVSPDWVKQRLEELKVNDVATGGAAILGLNDAEVEINEAQVATHLGELFMGAQWLRQRLSDWGVVGREARAYEATEELAQMVADNAIVHYRLIRKNASELRDKWQGSSDARRELTLVEVPNALMLGDLASIVGQNAPFLEPEWLHGSLVGAGIIDAEGDVAQAQMMGMAQDEQGNVQQVPIDVLVYRIRLERVLARLEPIVRELVAKDITDPAQMEQQFLQQAPWAEQFVDAGWLAAQAAQDKPRVVAPGTAVVSIETGVAGQSADLVLESEARPEDVAHTSEQDAVRELGGLHIIGTERHESRRIDNQLRGRAGRQGDPGSSRFYASLEDELWRLFGVRGQFLLNQWDEDEAVEHKLITKSIERAQKKVELNHFESRKHVLQYDDVMNVQREVIYRERRRALLGGDVRDTTLDMAQQAAVSEAEKHCPREVRPEEWDTHKLYLGLARLFGAASLGKHLKQTDLEGFHWHAIEENMGQARFDADLSNGESLYSIMEKLYHEREESLGEDHMRNMERYAVTRSIDEHWMEHLAEMDYLRDAIWQESYAQKEPIGVFRQEGFGLFQKMLGEIRREVTDTLFGADAEPDMDTTFGGFPMLNMEEIRMLSEGQFDPDGMDDGVMLDKDADGDDTYEPTIEDGFEPATVTNFYEPAEDEDEAPTADGSSAARPNGNGNAANGGNGPRKKGKSKRRH